MIAAEQMRKRNKKYYKGIVKEELKRIRHDLPLSLAMDYLQSIITSSIGAETVYIDYNYLLYAVESLDDGRYQSKYESYDLFLCAVIDSLTVLGYNAHISEYNDSAENKEDGNYKVIEISWG